MRAQVVIEVVPEGKGTAYSLEIWDYDRETRVRPIYTLRWVTHDSTKVDEASILAHARHIAYVAYSRIGDELQRQDQARAGALGGWNSGGCA